MFVTDRSGMLCAILICALPFVTACASDANGGEPSWELGVNKTVAAEFRMLVEREVPVGTTRLDVEQFFEHHDISFEYDDYFYNRYDAIVRNVESDSRLVKQSVVIRVYIGDNGRVVRTEVFDVI